MTYSRMQRNFMSVSQENVSNYNLIINTHTCTTSVPLVKIY